MTQRNIKESYKALDRQSGNVAEVYRWAWARLRKMELALGADALSMEDRIVLQACRDLREPLLKAGETV